MQKIMRILWAQQVKLKPVSDIPNQMTTLVQNS